MKTVEEIELSSLSLSKLELIAKVKRIKNYENISKSELFGAFKKSIPFKVIEEIRNENSNENIIIRDLRAL